MKSKTGILSYKSDKEVQVDKEVLELFRNCPIPAIINDFPYR